MGIYRCKMCGAPLEIEQNVSACTCEYCGTPQALPKFQSNEKVNQLFDRANFYRMKNEFDRAAGIYESVIAESPDEPEAYWGLCLCSYGIEYVEDPKSRRRVPTCHRTSYKSILIDENYLKAVELADSDAKQVYTSEAEYIDGVQKKIIEISSKEEPYDIFICYKETDNSGNRTKDSVVAQDIYSGLTEKGYKVFFSRITLEDKLGTAYEPYIFAALNSAKIMLVVGSSTENINAVWVKNEWSRYLSLINKGQKKTLIPCYRDISPYDLPDEFAVLQSQDLSKIGYMQDLVRGIDKIMKQSKAAASKSKAKAAPDKQSEIEPLLIRAEQFIEDKNYNKAFDYCNHILDIEPSCAEAIFMQSWALYNTNTDFKKLIKRLEKLSPEMTEIEKRFVKEYSYGKCFLFYMAGEALNRMETILLKHPKVLDTIIDGRYNCYETDVSLLTYIVTEVKSAKILDLLFKTGVDPNKIVEIVIEDDYEEETEYRSLLSCAIYNGNRNAIKALIKNGADPNKGQYYICDGVELGEDSVLGSALVDSISIAKLLLESGADPNHIDKYKMDNNRTNLSSTLSNAIYNEKDSIKAVKLLLEYGAKGDSYSIRYNKHGLVKQSDLGKAIWRAKNPEMIQLLLAAGANPNFIDDVTDDKGVRTVRSMLSYAIIEANNLEIVKMLLARGASWDNTITYGGKTKTERKFPYKKYVTPEFCNELKKLGWKGSWF